MPELALIFFGFLAFCILVGVIYYSWRMKDILNSNLDPKDKARALGLPVEEDERK